MTGNSIREVSEGRFSMNDSLRFIVVLGIAVLLLALLGCSGDDDNGTNSPAKSPGNNYDLNYVIFKSEIFSCNLAYVDRIQVMLDLCFAQSPERVPTYHASSQYWYNEHIDTSSYGIEKSYDSVQFLHSGVPVESPDSNLLTQIKGGSHWILIDTATAKSGYTTVPGDTHFVVSITCDITGEPGEIAGAGNVSIGFHATSTGLSPGTSSDCEWSCEIAASADGLSMNITDDNCPTSGVIDYFGPMIMNCPWPLPSYNNTWEATETFNDGGVSWRIENETYYWIADGYCAWYLDY